MHKILGDYIGRLTSFIDTEKKLNKIDQVATGVFIKKRNAKLVMSFTKQKLGIHE